MRLSFRSLLFPALIVFISFAGTSVARADTISRQAAPLATNPSPIKM
jgi:hypothetical protein